MDEKNSDWFLLAVLGFMGGVVSNIVVPVRRGILGFLSAALVGVFCGGMVGIVLKSTGIHPGWTYLLTGSVAVFGDRILSFALKYRIERQMDVHIHGGQNNIGDNDIHGDQKQNEQ